ncbi:MAG: hypothetical protein ACKVU0_19300 [Saprospiraceae bacterium]
MQHFDWKILPLLFLLCSCKNKQATENQLFVLAEQASLRHEPNEKSPEILSLRKGRALNDLGEVGPSEAQIAFGCDVFQTPWIKVQTAEKQSGWVLAWALRPANDNGDWLLQKRLIGYFGKTLAVRRNSVMQNFSKLETEEQFAEVWRGTVALRDTFLFILSRRPESGFQPEFNWLNDAFPGYLFQKVGAEEGPMLVADFFVWHQKSLITKGLQDDAFIQTCMAAFQTDSIESLYPVWKFPLPDLESASQLGLGFHLKLLRQIDRAMEYGTLFAPELEGVKEQVLEDVFGKNQRYWQPQEKILAEMEQILTESPKCLNVREKEALVIRKKMFEDPIGNAIVVNLRSGE